MTDAPRSNVPGIVWPALPDPPTAMLLALTWQLEHSQWWSPAEIAAQQARQRAAILAHAADTVPHYEALDPDDWARVPILSRDRLIAAGARLASQAYPSGHGPVEDAVSSRSTGEPVRVQMSGVMGTLWHAITLRDHLWHARDLHGHLAVIRYTAGGAPAPDGVRARGWGASTAIFAPEAPMSLMTVTATTDEHVAWLERARPDYLLVYPNVLEAILRRLSASGTRLPSIREVRTTSELLRPELRALCREVLGVPIVDTYSASEVGYIALQCPEHEHYHVQAERLFVEILDDDDRPCEVGETGRVVITDLHNFATPLLRYDIGDYAEVGAPCPCGRGLPVLRRIVGRRRGMLMYPDGRTVWPVFTVACRSAVRHRGVQIVQTAIDTLRVRIVPEGPADGPTSVDEAALARALRETFGHPFTIEIEIVPELARSPAGKLEEFVSLVR